MFECVIPGNTKAVLALLEKNEIIKKAYPAGGTALALQLGHRISYDIDFFTQEEFSEERLLAQLKKIPNFHLEQMKWRTTQARFTDTRFSIFYYPYPLLYPPKKFGMVNVADTGDIAAAKIAAISSRGTKRDFVDLYFICKEFTALKKSIKLYDKKYRNFAAMKLHILKSLVYFEDAEPEEMPKMLKAADWNKIKQYFISEVKKIV